jgi:phage tail-like protein
MPEAAQKAPQPAPGATPGSREDPLRNYLWEITLGGILAGQFITCRGLEVRVDAIPFWEGGDLVERKVPGRVSVGTVTLEKGITKSTASALWSWMKSVTETPPVKRQTVMLKMLDTNGTSEVMTFVLYEAWPSAWRAAPLDAASSTIAIQHLELTYERLAQDVS